MAKVGKVVIAAGVVVALAGLGGAAAYTGFVPLPGGATEAAAPAPAPDVPPPDAVVATLDEIIVDIAARTVAGAPARQFLKADLVVVYRDADAAGRGAARKMHLRDAFTDYLRQLDARDLQGSAGLARLRSDLLHRARVVVGPHDPVEVLVADLVIQ